MSGKLKEVRIRIQSVKSTQQITKAMKMVAAAKLRKAQTAITEMRPYSQKLNNILQNIVANLEGDLELSYGKVRPVSRALVVVITSDRGLCGAFNTNVIKEAVNVINTTYKGLYESGNLSVLCIGKKGYDYFRRRYAGCNLIPDFVEIGKTLSFDNVEKVAELAMKGFDTGTFDSVHVAYGRFRNPAIQYPECEQFLPVPKGQKAAMTTSGAKHKANFLFEPNKDELLNVLVPTILKTQLFRYTLESAASEQGARMTAMSNATDNAQTLVNELLIMYNKARQEAITKEISEIVGGAAALEG